MTIIIRILYLILCVATALCSSAWLIYLFSTAFCSSNNPHRNEWKDTLVMLSYVLAAIILAWIGVLIGTNIHLLKVN